MIPSSSICNLKEESLRKLKAQRNKVVKGECPGLRLMYGVGWEGGFGQMKAGELQKHTYWHPPLPPALPISPGLIGDK